MLEVEEEFSFENLRGEGVGYGRVPEPEAPRDVRAISRTTKAAARRDRSKVVDSSGLVEIEDWARSKHSTASDTEKAVGERGGELVASAADGRARRAGKSRFIDVVFLEVHGEDSPGGLWESNAIGLHVHDDRAGGLCRRGFLHFPRPLMPPGLLPLPDGFLLTGQGIPHPLLEVHREPRTGVLGLADPDK